MEAQPNPEFAIDLDLSSNSHPPVALDEVFLSIRERLQDSYADAKRAANESKEAQEKLQKSEDKLLLDMIGLADKFDDAFETWSGRRGRKQKAIVESFQIVYTLLVDMLESHDVHQVAIEGKGYHDVTFMGMPVPNPWRAVGVYDEEQARANKVVRKTARTLWVRVSNGQLRVMRQGQAVC